MTRTTHRRAGVLIAALLAGLLSLSAVSPALAVPDHRDDFALGRYADRGDHGDWSSVLTQSLAILALGRAADADPSDAAVDLLLAQQCDDGAFPEVFRAPSTAGSADCVGAVDTTAFAVQTLDALGEDDAVADATAWLAATQQADGSLGSEDGLNSTSTGLAALALEIGGHTQPAQDARDWVLGLQDGCDAETPGAIPFRPGGSDEDRGIEVMSTSQALLGLSGQGLGSLDAGTAGGNDPTTGCADDPEGEFGDAAEAATAYLVGELEDGDHLMVQGFASPGATIDVLFALAAEETGGDTIDAIVDWLDGQAAGYTQGAGFDAEDAAYAGATAKLALATIVTRGDPREVGGIDLVAQLGSLEVTEPPEVTVSCDAEQVVPGDEVACTLTGLLGGETVDVLVELDPVLLDEAVTADSAGDGPFAFTVPEDADEGTVTVAVAGVGVDTLADLELTVAGPETEETDEGAEDDGEVDDIDQDGASSDDGASDDADAATDEDVLPETGDQLSIAVGIGAASLLIGLGLLAATWRRRKVEHA